MNVSEIMETAMMICFGLSWPTSLYKSYTSRTTRGKSLLFIILVDIGYVCGIVGKLVSGNITYVLAFYILNFCMVFADICLYFRNRGLERKAER